MMPRIESPKDNSEHSLNSTQYAFFMQQSNGITALTNDYCVNIVGIVNFEYLVLVSFDWVPIIEQKSSEHELVELSWIVVYNGSDSVSSTSKDRVLHKCQLWIAPEKSQICLEDYPELNKAISASSAFQQVCRLFWSFPFARNILLIIFYILVRKIHQKQLYIKG